MAKRTTKAAAASTRVTLADRLNGKTGFQMGPYKSAHVAHSFASQARAKVRENGGNWVVTVNAEDATVRFALPRKARSTSQSSE